MISNHPSPLWKYTALISYTGTQYCGWQRQKVESEEGYLSSVQSTLEGTLLRITGEKVSIVGSGRTDAGVHSSGQVMHFVLREKEWDPAILHRAFNGLLPKSIQVLFIQRVAIEFHAQRSALKKQYSYYFQQGPCPLPHLEPYTWWIRKELNTQAMQEAIDFLVGQHDFKPFQASGAKIGTTVRKVLEAQIECQPLPFPDSLFHGSFGSTSSIGLVRVRIVGTGFLKQMVRGIAGTLLQVGENRRPAGCMQEILTTLDRSSVGPTAPARALWQEKVWYPEEFGLGWQRGT